MPHMFPFRDPDAGFWLTHIVFDNSYALATCHRRMAMALQLWPNSGIRSKIRELGQLRELNMWSNKNRVLSIIQRCRTPAPSLAFFPLNMEPSYFGLCVVLSFFCACSV